MNLVILAALSLIFALGLSLWLSGRASLIQTWHFPDASYPIALSPDGQLLATPSGPYQKRKIGIKKLTANTTVKLRRLSDGEAVRTLDAFYVTQLAFSPDNSLIAAGTGLGEIWIWRTDSGQLLHSLKASMIKPQMSRVNTLIFSPDGETLVTGVGGQIDVWQVADGQLRYSLSTEKTSFADIAPDGQILAIGGRADNITLYQLSDGTRLRQLEVNGRPRFSAGGQLLAITYSTSYRHDYWQKVLLYRLEDDTSLGALPGLEEPAIALAFSPDGRYLAATYSTGGYRGSALIIPESNSPVRWHLALWRLASLPSEYSAPQILRSQEKSLTALAFSPDGKILVSGGDAIRLWRMPP